MKAPSVCFVGIRNLPALAPEFGHLGIGGAELQQCLLAKALAARGIRVSMVVADHGQPDGAVWNGVTTYRAYLPDAGVPVLRFIHPRWTSVWAALKRADADIYYVSCAGVLVWQVTLYARLFKRKTVFRVASDSDCDPKTLLIRFWRDRKLYGRGLRQVDLVLSQTPHQQELLLRNYGRNSRVVRPMAEWSGRRPPFEQRDIDVLWVSNFVPLKRAELLLRLAQAQPGLRFHMIGGPVSGSAEYFDAMKRGAAAHANVRFHGAVPYHAISDYFERARVVVNTSDTEGFPNTYLQAWGHGAPVVAFLDPASLITRNGLGRCVASFDELQAGAVAFATDRDAWEAASAHCREYMDREYDGESAVEPYLSALSAL